MSIGAPLFVRQADAADAEPIAAIYNHYVRETVITFEEEPVSTAEMTRRIATVQAARFPWLVIEDVDTLLGYAYATEWKTRSAYRFSVELTIYLAPDRGGRGLGSQLYTALLRQLETRPIHAVLGGIALPNQASIALHEKLGFQKVAHFPEVGFKHGRWVDVGYWQRTFASDHHRNLQREDR